MKINIDFNNIKSPSEDDIKRVMDDHMKSMEEQVKHEWVIASVRNMAAGMAHMASGDVANAVHRIRVAAECAHMATNYPCELTTFLRESTRSSDPP